MVKEYVASGNKVNGERKIWRYMDFTKFISLLYRQELFFPKADSLGDPFEGSLPKINVKKMKGAFSSLDDAGLTTLYDFYKKFIRCTAINCWHMNDEESDAMWKLYIKGGEGIAIQSTVGRLKNVLSGFQQFEITVGKVSYINYDHEKIPTNKSSYTIPPYFHKRTSFNHEREYRSVIQRVVRKGNDTINFKKSNFKGGEYVSVNLESLIENVYISPTSPDWQQNVAQSLVKKYSLNRNVKQSKLSELPN